MDPRKLMERLKGAAALTEQDVGEFSHFKGKMMKSASTTMPWRTGAASPCWSPVAWRG